MYVLLLLLATFAAALGWQTLAQDPGQVVIHFGHTSVSTTLVFAVAALLLAWGVASLAWRLLRWPLAAWSRRSRRRGRERIAGGLVALAEGRYQQASRELERASHQSGLRAPALLAAARAAHARGEDARTDAALDEAAAVAPAAALALRARFLLERGEAAQALAQLNAARDKGALAPSAQRLLVEAALAEGDRAAALAALGDLAKSQSLPAEAFGALEARVLPELLRGATDAPALHALWAGLTRAQRRRPEAVAAYARRAAALGEILPAMSELEAALRREWSELVVRAYGELGSADLDTRLRHAEGWLGAQPNSAALLLTLGRLCTQSALWGKAREYLERGIALAPSPALWEALGDCCSGRGETVDAAACYRNALLTARGAAAMPLDHALALPLDTRASAIEERTEHGVPRLRLG